MLDYSQLLFENFEAAMETLLAGAKQELRDQGFYNTGESERKMNVQINEISSNILEALIMVPDHIMVWDKGIKRSKVPYTRSKKRGGTSKYITGLIEYFKSKGLGSKEAKSRAFATANKAKYSTGHVTKPYYGGATYSKNGKRKGWIKRSYSKAKVNKAFKVLGVRKLLQDSLQTLQVA